MCVYIDIVLIINIVMNSIILILTGWVVGIKFKYWRIICSAGLGSLYVLCGILPALASYYSLPCKILMSFILVLVAFGFKSISQFVFLCGSFFVIAFILGGAVAGWLYFLSNSNNFSNMAFIHLSLGNLLWGTFIGAGFIIFIMRRMMVNNTKRANLYKVKIEYAGRWLEVAAKLDTGNGLYTLIGRKPIILVNQAALASILSIEVVEFLHNHAPDAWLANLHHCDDVEWLNRIQVIPYHAVGNNNMLLVFRPDNIMIKTPKGFSEVNDVYIAVYSGVLSMNGFYEALLHPQIVSELNETWGMAYELVNSKITN